jgi:hypothetical protein
LDENSVISFLIEIFRHLKAHFTLPYTKNVVHTAFCVETGPAARKKQSFVDIDEKSVISVMNEIFRLLNSHFTPFYTQNVVHSALLVGTGPAARGKQSLVDSDENCYFVPD